MRVLALVGLGLATGGIPAATVESVEVAHPGERYTVSMRVQVGVSAADAFAVMTDFPALPEVNPNVVKAERLAGDRLRTVISMCIGFFCKRIRQVQSVATEAGSRLAMRVVPEKSDLRFGEAEWRFEPLGTKRSRIVFHAELEPDFWVPPLVGPWIIQNKLEAQAVQTSKGIEREARERNP